jgi:hypothetical protein
VRFYSDPRILIVAPAGVPAMPRPASTLGSIMHSSPKLATTCGELDSAMRFQVHVGRFGLTFPCSLIVLWLTFAWPVATARIATSSPAILAAPDILSALNASRALNHRPPFVLDAKLSAAARLKLADMQRRSYFGHADPEGRYVWHFLADVHCRYQYAAENLGEGFSDARSLEAAWMKSAAHRANILSRLYKEVGIAVLQNPPRAVVVFADSCE